MLHSQLDKCKQVHMGSRSNNSPDSASKEFSFKMKIPAILNETFEVKISSQSWSPIDQVLFARSMETGFIQMVPSTASPVGRGCVCNGQSRSPAGPWSRHTWVSPGSVTSHYRMLDSYITALCLFFCISEVGIVIFTLKGDQGEHSANLKCLKYIQH